MLSSYFAKSWNMLFLLYVHKIITTVIWIHPSWMLSPVHRRRYYYLLKNLCLSLQFIRGAYQPPGNLQILCQFPNLPLKSLLQVVIGLYHYCQLQVRFLKGTYTCLFLTISLSIILWLVISGVFSQGRSCVTTLLTTTYDWYRAIKNGRCCCCFL